MKFFYSLIVYAFSIVITLSVIKLFVSGQSKSEEWKIYNYSEGKFIIDYLSDYYNLFSALINEYDGLIADTKRNEIKSYTLSIICVNYVSR